MLFELLTEIIKKLFNKISIFHHFIKFGRDNRSYSIVVQDWIKMTDEEKPYLNIDNPDIKSVMALVDGLLKGVNEGFLIIDQNSVILEVNDQFLSIHKLKRSEVIGQHCHKLAFHKEAPCNGEGQQCPLKSVFIKSEPARFEYIHHETNGSDHVIELSGYPLFDKYGYVEYMVVIINDITEQKLMEERSEYYSQILDNVSDAIISSDMNFIIKSWNPAAEKIYGWKEKEVMGKSFLDVTKAEFKNNGMEKMMITFLERGYAEGELKQYNKIGYQINTFFMASMLKNDKGKPVGAVVICKNITDEKRKIMELKASEKKYRKIIDNLPLGFHMYGLDDDGDLIFLGYNPASEKILDLENSQFMGKTIHEAFPGMEKTGVMKKLKRIAKYGGISFIEDFNYKDNQDESAFENYIYQPSPGTVAALFSDVTEKKKAEKDLKKRTHDIGERVKELNGLYTVAKAIANPNNTLDDIIQATVEIIPPSWQYPEITSARITLNGKSYRSENFQEGEWCLETTINASGEEKGSIEVYYSEEKPDFYEGPFLKEERNLINNLGRQLGTAIERREAEEARAVSENELAIRNKISEIFLTIPDENMYHEILNIILEAMKSEYGIFGYIDEQGALAVPTMTRHIWDKCQVTEKTMVFPRDSWGNSTWPESIRQKRIIYSNEPSTNAPEGHISISRHISMPIIHKYEVIGLIQVANKEEDYSDEDKKLLETIANKIAPVLKARLERDLIEKERAEAEKQMIEERNRAELYLDILGHDITNINQAIMSSNELLLKKPEIPEVYKKNIVMSLQQSKTISNLISNLHNLTGQGADDPELKHMDFRKVLDRSHSRILSTFPDKKIEIKYALDEPKIDILGNDLLEHAFFNILFNSVRHNRNDSIKIDISCGPENDVNFWKLEFKDNGPGIIDEMKDVVFKRLQRGSETIVGSGLGLAMVQKVVNMCGGKVWVEDRVKDDHSKGSNFIITLPRGN